MQVCIEQSVTRIFKAVFPDSTNHYDTLFGGTAMYLMDEVAFITYGKIAWITKGDNSRLDYTYDAIISPQLGVCVKKNPCSGK